jgi:hypothetical protein
MADHEDTRKAFEDTVFNRRFRASIKRNPNPPKGFGGLDFISTDCPTKDELCRRDADGNYADEAVSAMWWGWCAALTHGVKADLSAFRQGNWEHPDHTGRIVGWVIPNEAVERMGADAFCLPREVSDALRRLASAHGVMGTVNPACGVHGPIPCEGAQCICASGVGGAPK